MPTNWSNGNRNNLNLSIIWLNTPAIETNLTLSLEACRAVVGANPVREDWLCASKEGRLTAAQARGRLCARKQEGRLTVRGSKKGRLTVRAEAKRAPVGGAAQQTLSVSCTLLCTTTTGAASQGPKSSSLRSKVSYTSEAFSKRSKTHLK